MKFFKSRKIKIGIVAKELLDYYDALPSVRLRVYDVINTFQNSEYSVEIFDENKNYHIVIFMKIFGESEVELAKKLKLKGTKVVLDMNTNIFAEINNDDTLKISLKNQKKSFEKFNEFTDAIIVISQFLVEKFKKYNINTFFIPEIITDEFFKSQRNFVKKETTSLIYSGYSQKADGINLIEDVLIELQKNFKLELIAVTDSPIDFKFIKTNFVRYNQKKLPELLLKGDIKVAPRDVKNEYNLGHSFTKVGYPMALGIPAVASPVPSYLNTEVIISKDNSEWYNNLENLLKNVQLQKLHGKRSREFVKNNFSKDVIKEQYKELFLFLLND